MQTTDELIQELRALGAHRVADHINNLSAELNRAKESIRQAEAQLNVLKAAKPQSLTLEEVGRRAHENCFKRGFHTPEKLRPVIKRVAHAHEELDEALLALSNNGPLRCVKDGKPVGILDELADVIILVAELAYAGKGRLPAFTLDEAVKDKLDYNDERTDGLNGNTI